MVDFGEGGGAFVGVGRGGGSEEVDGIVAEATVGLNGEGDEVRVGVAEAFVVFGLEGGVESFGGNVFGSVVGGGLWYGVDDGGVDVGGGGFVCGDDVKSGGFGSFDSSAWVGDGAVKFRDVDFLLCVVAVGVDPGGEGAFDLVVAVDSVFAGGAGGGVGGVRVELVVAGGLAVVVVALCGGGVEVDAEAVFEGGVVVEFREVVFGVG